MKRATIVVEPEGVWELWAIEIFDDDVSPDDITVEWLNDNHDKWEYYDLEDRGSTNDVIAEVCEVTEVGK